MSQFNWFYYLMFFFSGICASACITCIAFAMISSSGVAINNNHVIKQIEVIAVTGVLTSLFLTFFAYIVVDYKMSKSIWFYYMIFIIIYGFFASACITCIIFAMLITRGVDFDNHGIKQTEVTAINGVFLVLFLTLFARVVVAACKNKNHLSIIVYGETRIIIPIGHNTEKTGDDDDYTESLPLLPVTARQPLLPV